MINLTTLVPKKKALIFLRPMQYQHRSNSVSCLNPYAKILYEGYFQMRENQVHVLFEHRF